MQTFPIFFPVTSSTSGLTCRFCVFLPNRCRHPSLDRNHLILLFVAQWLFPPFRASVSVPHHTEQLIIQLHAIQVRLVILVSWPLQGVGYCCFAFSSLAQCFTACKVQFATQLLSVHARRCIVLYNHAASQFNPLKPNSSVCYTLPCGPNLPFLIFDILALWRSALSARVPECQKLQMLG